jgi:hypothetical protein
MHRRLEPRTIGERARLDECESGSRVDQFSKIIESSGTATIRENEVPVCFWQFLQ